MVPPLEREKNRPHLVLQLTRPLGEVERAPAVPEDIPDHRSREVLAEPDPQRQLRLNARNSRAAKTRIAGVLKVIRNAAPLDRDIDAPWQRIQSEFHANQRVIVERLAEGKALRRGLGVDRATDILWTVSSRTCGSSL